MPKESWTLLGSRQVSDERIFRLRHDHYRLETTGAEQQFIVLETPDWVNVVPVTDDGQVVLIRQFRHGVREVTLEVPGGMVDAGEDPAEAARRELIEETGYAAARMRFLARVRPNPAIQDNTLHFYLAEGCRPVTSTKLDPLERIELLLVPLAEIPTMVRRGEIDHGMVLAAFGFLGWMPPLE